MRDEDIQESGGKEGVKGVARKKTGGRRKRRVKDMNFDRTK